jgi:uncharacterized phage protein (TIGR02220 family)
MSVFRVEKNKDYTIMSNYHFKEKEMSLKAKGLLSLMLSLPDNWDYSIAGLVAICKENETSIKSALDELKEFGYLEVIKKMPNETKTGRIEYEYIVYEQKRHKIHIENLELKVGKEAIQEVVKQDLENLGVEILQVENPLQYNNKVLNNKKNNIIYSEVLDYFNQKAGTHYRQVEGNYKHIKARLQDFTIDDLKAVIDKKCDEWKGTEWEKYLTLETLFRPSNFEKYLNQKITYKSNQTDKKPKQRQYTQDDLDNLYSKDIEDILL